MFIGSLGLWVGTPLLWLWVGSQIQGATQSLGTALAAAFFGVVLTVTVVASLLSRLSDVYRANCMARGMSDPGPVDARGRARGQRRPDVAAFVVWFFFLAGTSPVPIGIHV